VPRHKTPAPVEKPFYFDENGIMIPDRIFKLQPKQTELLTYEERDGGVYLQARAGQCLSVGGIRSGKTVGWLMYFVLYYCLYWECCDILVLRRTFKELEAGAITDFKTFVPKELYDYDSTKHIATFHNGSRVIFGHCQNNKMRDIEQYLGHAYPAILIDECGQFSPDAWMLLYSRNVVNPACKPDKFGNLPVPVIVGCSNPLGPFYDFYRTIFTLKEPWQRPENARKREADGTWWIPESGEWNCIYNPVDYIMQRSTVMDNNELLKRDPGIIQRLNAMPKAKRDKFLLGLDGPIEGQFFDCFDPYYHVINTREDSEAIIWQNYQPVWAGQDWGMGHANTIYLFTKALVRHIPGADYKLKTVCFGEIVSTGGKTHKEIAAIFKTRCKLPNGTEIRPKAIYFSHEKFRRQVSERTPADEYSKELKALGLPGVVMATQDRIASASVMYNGFKNGDLVILDVCKDIIIAIPGLMRDPDNIDDVLKTEAKSDDCYDGFRYGYFGEMKSKKRPAIEAILDHAKKLDPLAAYFYKMKMLKDQKSERAPFVQASVPYWMVKGNFLK